MTAIAEFRKRKIPIDNIVLDWSYWREKEWGSQDFDEKRFPDPQQMIDDLHKKKVTAVMITFHYNGLQLQPVLVSLNRGASFP